MVADDIRLKKPKELELRFHPEEQSMRRDGEAFVFAGKSVTLRCEPLNDGAVRVDAVPLAAQGRHGEEGQKSLRRASRPDCRTLAQRRRDVLGGSRPARPKRRARVARRSCRLPQRQPDYLVELVQRRTHRHETLECTPGGPEMKTLVLFAGAASFAASVLLAQDARRPNAPSVRVIQGGDSAQDYRQCRRMLVGPGVNQPDPYPGYRGFVGWQSPIVLQDGTMLVGFSSGYWHASPPTAYFAVNPAAMEEWKKIGMPTDVDAPRGGRAEIIRSTDGGKTWSRPTVLLDTPWDDRAPNFCQLQDGTILCSLFTYPGPSATDLTRDPAKTTLTGIIRSFDNGRTWEQEPKRLPVPFVFDATDGPIIKLQDGSALICVYGRTVEATARHGRLLPLHGQRRYLGASLDRVHRPRDVRDRRGPAPGRSSGAHRASRGGHRLVA